MKNSWLLLAPLIFAIAVSPYTIEGIFPSGGPTLGETRVTIYSPSFRGMNYTDHPTPKCQFPGDIVQPASWIHCYGSATHPSPTRDQTCLNCESPPNDSPGTVKVKVSINGDFKDTAEVGFTYYTQPEVTYATPTLGWKTGGTFVQVFGKNFVDTGDVHCSFGTIMVPGTFVSSNMVTCKSPPSDVVDTPTPLRVTLNRQQLTVSKANYFYHSVPEISELIPNEGPITGGTEVIIKGRQMHPFQHIDLDFKNTTFAKFGTDHIVSLELINRTHARTIAPASVSATRVTVEITFNDQEWTSNGIPYGYYISPYVVKLIPDIGILEGGTNVTVSGANLYKSDEIKCRFADKIVEGNYINETSVWCISPPGDHVGKADFGLSIEHNHFSGNQMKFTYIQQPVIDTVSPTCGPTTGFTQLTITGRNFVFTSSGKVSCIFGNDIYTPATVINETLLYCDTPSVLDRFGNNLNDTYHYHIRLTLNEIETVESKFDFNYYTNPSVLSISPKIGPIKGNTKVTVATTDLSKACAVTCRFAAHEVPGTIVDKTNNIIACNAPVTECSGDSVVQVSLNGQQYSQNNYNLEDAVFTHYAVPVIGYSIPNSFPTGGNSSIGIYGSGFLLSKNSSTLDNGVTKIYYECRFKDGNNVLGVSNSTFFTDFYIYCKTPPIESAISGISLEISPNGQTWLPVPSTSISFYNSPLVSSIEPKFGKVKQADQRLSVYGRYFDCPEENCNVQCAFAGPNFKVLTDGTRQNSELVYCPIPSLSRPEVVQVQVTMNGVDFTPQQVFYTYYDAFVVNLDPSYIPVEGNVEVKVIGLGFAETSQLKVRLHDSKDNAVLSCSRKACVLPAKFVSPTELTFTAPAQADVRAAGNEGIGFRPIQVEVSIYGDVFTENKVQLNYFYQPTVGANMTVNGTGTSFNFHENAQGAIFVPITIAIPEGTRAEEFLRKTRPLCKYHVGSQDVVTQGKLVEYPYPYETGVDVNQISIECEIPHLDKPGTGTVSVALNGQNFVGSLPLTVRPQIKINSVEPRCGPLEGGTYVDLGVGGIDKTDFNNLYFSWSTVCTNPLTAELFTKGTTISTTTPPAPHLINSGGSSLVVFSAVEKVAFTNSTQDRIRNHFESTTEFLYYRRPIITRIYPHGGVYTGGTPVIVEGAYFFQDQRYGCTPKCRFGNTLVEAEYISTVRLRCVSPAGALGSFVSVSVTVNGQDSAVSDGTQTFAYLNRPNIDSITPTTGSATGGTMITLVGKDFVDMSKYPEEFACIFTPVDLSEPPKVTPAIFLNSSAITCATPGGWHAGTVTTVEVSFNGIDFSKNKNQFRFYQIHKIWPVSGPSSGGSVITIEGDGLIPNVKKGNVACKFGNSIVPATVATNNLIQCPLPASLQGPAYYGHSDFYYTLDGEKWEQVVQGFTYYQQPEISQVIPKFISANGGRLKVKGNNFRSNFYGANLTCKVDNTVVPAEFVSNTEINCPFTTVDFNNDPDHYIQVSQNSASYTEKNENTKINVFKVSSIKPALGLVEGGTQILINGDNFPPGTVPICKFGVPGRIAVSYGTFISDRKISCSAPAAKLPQNAAHPFVMPFSLGFDNDATDTWDRTGLYYVYYTQPDVIDISPRQVVVDESVLVTITSSDKNSFNNSIAGSNIVKQTNFLDLDIVCRFGKFGTTNGALLAHNQIACPSPNSKFDATDISEEAVNVEIALNGQDFMKVPFSFKFVGVKPEASGENTAWIMITALGAISMALIVYAFVRFYPVDEKKSRSVELMANYPKSDDPNVKEAPPAKIIL